MSMKRQFLYALAFLVSGLPGFASSLGTATRSVIPSEVQQIINVDYRRMKNSDTAMAMKAKRSEERRVGKECKPRWVAHPEETSKDHAALARREHVALGHS